MPKVDKKKKASSSSSSDSDSGPEDVSNLYTTPKNI